MASLFEVISKRLSEVWRPRERPLHGHAYYCQCGRPVFFRNSQCLGCGAALGYLPELRRVLALTPGPEAGSFVIADDPSQPPPLKRCDNFDSPAGCNWLVDAADEEPLCRSCRLNRTIPELNDANNQRYWRAIENAKRRLVAQLLALGLPVQSKVSEDPESGLMFDLLRSTAGGPKVMTGHANGLITLNIEEADDSIREKIRHDLHEPYRTLIGHFRHEVGHYYWDRLVVDTRWQEPFREVFGDDRTDYAAALKKHYQNGPVADWATRHISSYASVHPWDDWAETWSHYLHVVDSLDTALGFGLTGDEVETEVEPFALEDLFDPKHPGAAKFLKTMNSWVQLVTVLNELARSMGQHDFYPFVMSRPVLRKLHFIHLVVSETREAAEGEG